MNRYYVYIYMGEKRCSLYYDENTGKVIVSTTENITVRHWNIFKVINFGLLNCFPDKIEVIPAD